MGSHLERQLLPTTTPSLHSRPPPSPSSFDKYQSHNNGRLIPRHPSFNINNFPTIRNLTPSTGTTSPTIAAPSVQRHPQNNIWFPPPHGTHHPVVTTPSPSALPSTASPSSMPSASLTLKTSKKKHTNSKKRTVLVGDRELFQQFINFMRFCGIV